MAKRKLVPSKTFEKAYIKFVSKKPFLKPTIQKALTSLEEDAFSPQLKTHKLSGNLFGLLACTCGYDCRIIFSIEKDSSTNKEVVLLIDIGTHDEVY